MIVKIVELLADHPRATTLIPKVKNDKGETITSRKGIANVFGEILQQAIC